MNEDQKRAAVTVLDRMVEIGRIRAMARNVSGEVQFIPTEQGYEIIKSLKRLFTSGRPFTPIELSAFVLLIKQLDQIR